jgi:putative lipoprotein
MKAILLPLGLLATCASAQPSAPAAAIPPAAPASFACADGQLVTLDHDRPAGVMRASRSGETLVLMEQVGRKPPRFVSGSDTLVLEGEEIRLERGREQRQVCRKLPDAPVAGRLWGTLTKMDRMALVPGSRAKVLLVDASRADAPLVEIASTRMETRGNNVPLYFLLDFDADRVIPRPMTYRLQARIEAPNGQLMWITDTATFVLEGAAPQGPVELRLVRTGGQ